VIDQAIMQMSKAYETTMNDLLLVRKEKHNLRAANEKEKQKRQRSKQLIPTEQGLTIEATQALIQGQVEASQAVTTAAAEPELPASQPVIRHQFRCSGCNVVGHSINQCPSRTSNQFFVYNLYVGLKLGFEINIESYFRRTWADRLHGRVVYRLR
jgi:hypothetical protein